MGVDELVLVSLGSNIDPVTNLPLATRQLTGLVRVEKASVVFESDPVNAPGTPRFCNAALAIRTDLEPRDLKLEVLRPIEAALGRVRSEDRNRPRPIDLDIALFGSRVVEDPAGGLEIPDPGILHYAHVILPLAHIAPDIRHPVTGETLQQIALRFGNAAGLRVRGDIRLL